MRGEGANKTQARMRRENDRCCAVVRGDHGGSCANESFKPVRQLCPQRNAPNARQASGGVTFGGRTQNRATAQDVGAEGTRGALIGGFSAPRGWWPPCCHVRPSRTARRREPDRAARSRARRARP